MATEIPPVGREIGPSAKLQVLATEHWSLLATRSLTYTESLSRVTINWSNSASDCSRAMSSSRRLGSENNRSGLRSPVIPGSLRVFATTKREFVFLRNLMTPAEWHGST